VPVAEAEAIALAYQRHVQAQRRTLETVLRRLWASLGEYRRPQMRQFTGQAVPIIAGAQINISALTSGFLATYKQTRLGGRAVPVAVSPKRVTGAAVRNGTSPIDVYERPFHLVWRRLSDGVAPDQAIQAGADRVVQSALSDLQLAKTHTARHVLEHDKQAAGYRRVLEGARSCGLCVVASTQRYNRSDLMPMHPACDCSVAPLYDADEQVIDLQRLADAHQAIRDTFGAAASDARSVDYRQLLVVHHHGELGPVVARKGAPFLGPHDL
jgi:hypothetical protein